MSYQIDIEEIMKEIRQNIKERGYDKEPLSFEDIAIPEAPRQVRSQVNMEALVNELEFLNNNWNNPANVPVNGGNPIGSFLKKIVRKCTAFIVRPIVNFQNDYNASNVRCLNQMRVCVAEMEFYKARIEQLEKELEQIKARQK